MKTFEMGKMLQAKSLAFHGAAGVSRKPEEAEEMLQASLLLQIAASVILMGPSWKWSEIAEVHNLVLLACERCALLRKQA